MKEWFVLEEDATFSASIIWELQRRFYQSQGVDAWRRQQVPNYVTSNPVIAGAYAEVVFAFARDLARQHDAHATQPLHLVELGGGSGRFAFYFLQRLNRLCDAFAIPLSSFRYVLTDAATANLDHWRAHPRLRPWFDSGVLDLAPFDVGGSADVPLELGGGTLGDRQLGNPLVVIGNYVFDSVPQDLVYIDNDGRCHGCRISLAVDEDPDRLSDRDLLERVVWHYRCDDGEPVGLDEPFVRDLLAGYQRALPDTYVLVPSSALRCLQRLRSISPAGLLVLAADKGTHRLTDLIRMPAPELIRHGGCFSLDVNFHALKALCEELGGRAFFPSSRHRHINVGCLLFVDRPHLYLETARAFARELEEFGPDDFYEIAQSSWRRPEELTVEEILAFLRLSQEDGHLLAHYLPRLVELAPELDVLDRVAVATAVRRVWTTYFSIAEPFDLAHEIGCLLYEMDDYEGALEFFGHSVESYGREPGPLCNMAECLRLIGQPDAALALVREVLATRPDHEAALALHDALAGSPMSQVGAAHDLRGGG